jgi:hypothetical protein
MTAFRAPHATAAGALATRDVALYRRAFPGLTIVEF